MLVGAGLTWGALPEAHGVAGPPLESRLQGLVSLPSGSREARVLCVHLCRWKGLVSPWPQDACRSPS